VVVNLGKTSVTYRVGIFVQQKKPEEAGRDDKAAAVIDFTHAYVHPNTRKSIIMPESARRGFERVLWKGQEKMDVYAKL